MCIVIINIIGPFRKPWLQEKHGINWQIVTEKHKKTGIYYINNNSEIFTHSTTHSPTFSVLQNKTEV